MGYQIAPNQWDGRTRNRPYAYDITEGRPVTLGVKRGTATCAIAKHAARGPTPACHTAGLARARALTERLSANALCQHNMCAQRDKSWPPTWRRCYGDVTSIHKVFSAIFYSYRMHKICCHKFIISFYIVIFNRLPSYKKVSNRFSLSLNEKMKLSRLHSCHHLKKKISDITPKIWPRLYFINVLFNSGKNTKKWSRQLNNLVLTSWICLPSNSIKMFAIRHLY